MKKRFVYLLSLLLILLMPLVVYAASYVGNKNTRKLHYIKCTYVSRMNNSNKVFFDSLQDAVKAGYVPCKVCSP